MYNDQIIERLSNYKNLYQGQKFQWIKGYPQGQAGTVSTVIDIEFTRNQIVALFENNNRVTIEQLNSCFQMVTNDMPPLSVSEVLSINEDPGLSEEIAAQIAEVKPKVDPRAGLQESTPVQILAPNAQTATVVQQPQVEASSIFGMFSLNPTKLKMDIEVKLPAMNLLKAMYSESANKEEFLQKVSQYVHQNITADSVRDAVLTKLGPIKTQR